jgi:hypothetical protein
MRSSIVTILLVASSSARAQPGAPGSDEHAAATAYDAAIDYEQRVRWQSELSLFVGDAPIDRVDASSSPGYSIASGIHDDRVTLLGEYTLAEVHYRAPYMSAASTIMPVYYDSSGLLHRVGITGRYSFAKLSSAEGVVRWHGDAWLEAGVGEQIAHWDAGGTFRRPDLALGIGLQAARRSSSAARTGVFVALRAQFGRRTDIDNAPPTCSAPCTMASPPAAWSDRSLLLHVGFLFGN